MPTAKVPKEVCVVCKGYRRLCGLDYCPILTSVASRLRAYANLSSNLLEGSSPPTAIVGEEGYPKVRVYVGIPPGLFGQEAKFLDSPNDWHMRLGLKEIISIRARLIHASLSADVRRPEELYEREVALACTSLKPVDLEARLVKVPKPVIRFDPLLPPSGPPAPAREFRVVSNPLLHRKLESLIWDDVKASEAVWTLYRSGLDTYSITRALTLGLLGRLRNRRLVPTRWGITAVDSLITAYLLRDIRSRPVVNDVEVYHAQYLHNKYTIIIVPGSYSSTWVEVWRPRSLWNPTTEPATWEVADDFRGRLTSMDGGFIAARTSVVEYLASRGKQARTIILREIEPEYVYPVGSWQIRLTVKYALSKGPVMKNPTPTELKEFMTQVHNVPHHVLDEVVAKTFLRKGRNLLDYVH